MVFLYPEVFIVYAHEELLFRYMLGAIIGHYAGRLFSEPHILGHGSSVFKVTSEDP